MVFRAGERARLRAREEEGFQGTVAPRSQRAVLFWKETESSAAEGASPLRTEKLPWDSWPGGSWYFDQCTGGKEGGT